jgi:LacI family transcriptional regulator
MGLVVPTLLHSFFAEVAHSISSVIRKKGYGLVISSSEEDAELEIQEIDQLLARSVDCLFVASAQWTVEGFRRIEERKTPYVLIDRKFVGLAANFVGVDDEQLGGMATDHLISIGCRRIAHIGAPYISTATGRFEGYRHSLSRHGLEVPPEYYLSTLVHKYGNQDSFTQRVAIFRLTHSDHDG